MICFKAEGSFIRVWKRLSGMVHEGKDKIPMDRGKRNMRKTMTVITVILLLVSCVISVIAEENWDCPECGRTGNTGNYCGNCMHPAPWLEEGYISDPTAAPFAGVRIDKTFFPDKAFRRIVTGFDKDENKILSADELAAVKVIDCSEKGIGSLKGIEYFTELEELNCSHNNLKAINVSSNTKLRIFEIGYNELTSLILDNESLTEVHSSRNQIVDLDVSRCVNLEVLLVTTNQLSALDISHNTKLNKLFCNNNQLTKLNTSKNKDLLALECKNNKLKKLDLTKNKKLERLRCFSNQITELNISNCVNLIKAEKEGVRTITSDGVITLYRVPERDEVQDEGDINTIRDTNYYGIYMDKATKLIME